MTTIDDLRDLFPKAQDIPPEHRIVQAIRQNSYLVDGQLENWTGQFEKVYSPILLRNDFGELVPFEIGSFPRCGPLQAKEALMAAVRAYDNGRGEWPTATVADRISCMQNFSRQMVARRREIVKLIMWEIGKSAADSEKEFDRTVEYMRATMDALKAQDNESSRFVIIEGTIGQIRRTPLGVVLCMGPYNYPLNETFATLIPALIMGNTVLLKPPEFGVLLFEPLLEAFRTAFPRGVVNTIYGKGAEIIPPILESGQVNALTFIGSSKVANHLKKLHPKVNRLRSILGLDAKNAAIVLLDADIDQAVKECLLGALTFNGQRCTALKFIMVHRSIVDEFLLKLVNGLANLKIGMPWVEGVNITPLPPNRALQMQALVDDATQKGARVMNNDGAKNCESLFTPAILYPITEDMRLYREEQFGPLIPIMAFEDNDTALNYVISSEYGQQVSIFSADPIKIGELVDPLVNQVSRVNINCQCQRGPDIFPFTGRKDSAEGTLSVTDALRSFSIRSMIATKDTDANQKLLNDITKNNRSKFINTSFVF
jgi:glyceraldehyde-3-phosphate dehydrogenase (NADP+)